MKRTLRSIWWPAAALLAVALPVRGAAAQFDLLPDIARQKGASVQAVRIEPSEQAAGGMVVFSVDFRCDEGYAVGPTTVEIALTGTGGAGGGITAGELALKDRLGNAVGSGVDYLYEKFTASVPVLIGRDVAPGSYELQFEVKFVPCLPETGMCLFPAPGRPSVALTVIEGPIVPPPYGGTPAVRQPSPSGGGRFAGTVPLAAIVIAFLLGFGLTLSPCIYPLIPVTIALIGSTSGRSRLSGLVHSVVYVLGISLTYSLAGVVAATAGGAFGAWLQHPAFSVVLAVIFVAMGAAMLDVYTLDFSSQRLQRLQAKVRGRGGLAGLLAVGLLSGAGVTACIAPVISSALAYVAQRGSPMLGFAMFFAMAWGFGVPLVVLGTFADMAGKLPKPGQWMVTVKHAMGLALLAVAVYYVGRSRLLGAFWFRMLTASFLLGAGVFVGAFDALTTESGWWHRTRKTVGLLLLAGAVVAFARPLLQNVGTPLPPGQGIAWLDSQDEAIRQARTQGAPVMLDFVSDSCVYCEKMLATTFVEPRVVAESQRFVCAKVNLSRFSYDEQVALASEHGFSGLPAVVLIGRDGGRTLLEGYTGPDKLLDALRSTE